MTAAVLPPAGTPGETWHPIASAPKDGTVILTWDYEDDEPVLARWEAYEGKFQEFVAIPGGWILYSIREWMPVTRPVTPPRAEGQDGGET